MHMRRLILKQCIAEFISTFALIFCGCGAMTINEVLPASVSHAGIAITFGLIVMAMIFAFGHISGAHMNPAVTISFAIIDKEDRKKLLPFIITQFSAAISAAYTLRILFPTSEFLGASLPSGSDMQSFILEFILTFILMMVILLASRNEDVKQFTAIAVGGVVLLEAMFAGPICGASMNPARSLGPAWISGHTESLSVYLIATTLGAILATFTAELFIEPTKA